MFLSSVCQSQTSVLAYSEWGKEVKMKKLLCERFGGKKGQTMIEYALILAAIILAVVYGGKKIREALKKKADEAATLIEEQKLEQ